MKDHLQLQEDPNAAVRSMSRGKFFSGNLELACEICLDKLELHRFQDELSGKNRDQLRSLVHEELNPVDRNLPAVRDVDNDLHNVHDTSSHVPVKREDAGVILMNTKVHNPAYQTLASPEVHHPVDGSQRELFSPPKMAFQPQGALECLPTTLAILSGTPKDDVVAAGLHEFAAHGWTGTWAGLYGNGLVPVNAKNAVVKILFKKFCPKLSVYQGPLSPFARAAEPPIPSKGAGAVVCCAYDSTGVGFGAHIMPYRDGKVLDPQGAGNWQTWDEWTRQHNSPSITWKTVQVLPQEEEEEE